MRVTAPLLASLRLGQVRGKAMNTMMTRKHNKGNIGCYWLSVVWCILVTTSGNCQQPSGTDRAGGNSSIEATSKQDSEECVILAERVDLVGTLKEVEHLGDELEARWSAGKILHYFELVRKLIWRLAELEVPSTQEQQDLLLKRIDLVIKKEPITPLRLECDLALLLIVPKAYTLKLEGIRWENLRAGQAKVVFHVWQTLREARDPTVDLSNPPSTYPSPPPGSLVSGYADPSSIKDPKLRKEFEGIIAEHSKKVRRFNEQFDLKVLLESYSERIEEWFIVPAYSRKPYKPDELKKYLMDCGVDEQRQVDIFKKIADMAEELEKAALQEEEDEMERLHGP